MDKAIDKLPESKHSIQEILGYFANITEEATTLLAKERRRYVVYLRRSTDDPKRQVRSLKDQRRECLALINMLGLPKVHSDDILVEKASAAKSDKRPVFNQMIRGFKSGKYHGLISWSPDRLARNMKEAGELIELVDENKIQDLHFKTYQFDNTPNGKMLLGILFATSKQYSDRLSVDAKRGISGNIQEGKYNGSIKKGYIVDPGTGYFAPDAENWRLVRKACEMKLYEKKTNVEITKYLNDIGFYARKYEEDEARRIKFTNKMVGDMFADKFYMGIYHVGETLSNLTELYNFMPVITPDEYIALNKDMSEVFDKQYSGSGAKPALLDYGLLRRKVICDYCDNEMQFQHQPVRTGVNKGKYVVTFYCRNKEGCQRHKTEENKANGIILKKSIRAKYVLAAIEWTLRNMTKRSKEAYDIYIKSISAMHEQDLAIARRQLSDAKLEVREAKAELTTYQRFQLTKSEDYEKYHKGKLEECQANLDLAESRELQAEGKLDKLSVALPSQQEFYELVDSYLLKLLDATDIVEQDAICNELVSNLRAGNDSVSVITLNPPYDLMVDLDKLSLGWDGGIRTPECMDQNHVPYHLATPQWIEDDASTFTSIAYPQPSR